MVMGMGMVCVLIAYKWTIQYNDNICDFKERGCGHFLGPIIHKYSQQVMPQ